MRVAKDHVDVRLEMPGVIIRQRTEFGDLQGFETISGEYFTRAAGVDTTPLFIGLEGDRCHEAPAESDIRRVAVHPHQLDVAAVRLDQGAHPGARTVR